MTTRTGTVNSFNCRDTLIVDDKEYDYYNLKKFAAIAGNIDKLPFSLKILCENLLRFEDNNSVVKDDVTALVDWLKTGKSTKEIAYRPARVLMQDFTGVPAVADLAAMRNAMTNLNDDPAKVNPLSPVDLVIDHSVMVDHFGADNSFKQNVDLEFERNGERYEFLRWGQEAFDNFRVVPPGTGICHQVNIEFLSRVVWSDKDQTGRHIAYPDTLVGTDSHTTMANGLGILAWGVGGIEAEAAMLGQPVSMLIPEVIGVKLTGKMKDGITATDLVLRIVEMLRQKGVVGKFVEFFGDGLNELSLADRATIANMAPEYGATCGIFPIDQQTIDYLYLTGRSQHDIDLTEHYAKAQGMWRNDDAVEPIFTDVLVLDLATIEPALAGPKRPQDRVLLSDAAENFSYNLKENYGGGKPAITLPNGDELSDGAVTIAAITSCTNTSNPSVLIAAGLVAKKANALGIKPRSWVKTSLAPGSQVVSAYLEKSDLQKELDNCGFNTVGYGCTTCIGNSGPLIADVAKAVEDGDLTVAGVLSGNRNFEGRVNAQIRANYLASPPLVVVYALAGNMNINITKDPIGTDKDGNPVMLHDVWPSNAEINQVMEQCLSRELFQQRYSDVFAGPTQWRNIKINSDNIYDWNAKSTYIQKPPFFDDITDEPRAKSDIIGAKILMQLGDSITTDHISPAGGFKSDNPAGIYLTERQIPSKDFNSYGARRGNHEVMMRGTFANIRIKNEIVSGKEGGFSKYKGQVMSAYDAAMKYQQDGTPLVVVAGKEYGTGSSRDWAAKGTRLLGVKAVIAESFERIHRSNLIGMGVLPLQFTNGDNRSSLGFNGDISIDIYGIDNISPKMDITARITYADGQQKDITLLLRIDTQDECSYYRHDGILHYVLRQLSQAA